MSCKTVCSVVFLSFSIFIGSKADDSIPTCAERHKSCCSGYIWNSSSNACENCMPGYTGINCSSKCPYPSYGTNCQGFCNCYSNQCDASRGCNTQTSDCLPGYTGKKCSSKCPYPSYGTKCQGICNCDFNQCDASRGCRTRTLDCLPGYTGKKCSSKCPYPSYGTKCQGICNCDSNQCDASRGCRTQTSGATTTQETNLSRNQSVRLRHVKTNFSSNIPVPIFSENEDKIFIFITTLGCVGFVLLTAHLIVYIIDRRRRSISVTTTCKNIPEQS